MPRTMYVNKTAAELRAEERVLATILRTGTLPDSNVRIMVDPAAIRARLSDVRQAVGPRAVMS